MVMQRPAKPWTPVRFRPQPCLLNEGVFTPWKSRLECPGGGTGRRKGLKIPRDLIPCRFDSGLGHLNLKSRLFNDVCCDREMHTLQIH